LNNAVSQLQISQRGPAVISLSLSDKAIDGGRRSTRLQSLPPDVRGRSPVESGTGLAGILTADWPVAA